jgi:alpha-L-fucosidase 2
MRRISIVLAIAAAGASTSYRAQDATAPTANLLWYRAPAANWNEALPVGNGRLAAMVFGGVRDERLQLNEESVWAGENSIE